MKTLDYSGISFPVTIKQIEQIKKQNEISISIFCYDGSIYPIKFSKQKHEKHIGLLYI